MKALLIVDLQYDFLPGGALAVPGGDEIIPLANDLQSRFPLVVATQDWHPEGHKSFASAHIGRKPFDTIRLNDMPQILWPDHCVQGSRGAALSDALSQHRIEAIFRKGTESEIDSYSAFYDNGRKKTTGLEHYLKGKGVTDLFVCGLAGDFCVAWSVADALEAGLRTTVIEDATRAISDQGYQKEKQRLLSMGAMFVTSSDIL